MKIPPLAFLEALPPFAIGTKLTTTTGKTFTVSEIVQHYQEKSETGEPDLRFMLVLKELRSDGNN